MDGIKTQVWGTLIAHLILNVIMVLSKTKEALSTIASLIIMHLIRRIELKCVVPDVRWSYTKQTKSKNKSPS